MYFNVLKFFVGFAIGVLVSVLIKVLVGVSLCVFIDTRSLFLSVFGCYYIEVSNLSILCLKIGKLRRQLIEVAYLTKIKILP